VSERAPCGHRSKVTLAEAADEWIEGAKRGTIRNASGDEFKPSTIRAYEGALRLRVLADLGAQRLCDITRADLQVFADRLLDRGLNPSTINVTLASMRVIYSRALERGQVPLNPTSGVKLPSRRGRRERIADPIEGDALLAAPPERDRALWATAMYAGLRRGELQALRWEDIDLAARVIRVRRGWDSQAGEISPKRDDQRNVLISKRLGHPTLPGHLVAHRIRAKDPHGRVFGSGGQPFSPTSLTRRAEPAWARAGLEPITLHECRHTYASTMIAAGANAKTISTYMGHANINITIDLYGHLMPGNEAEAADLLDAYLDRHLGEPVPE